MMSTNNLKGPIGTVSKMPQPLMSISDRFRCEVVLFCFVLFFSHDNSIIMSNYYEEYVRNAMINCIP